MSGHSKWSTIKHKKAKTDSQRAKVFTKIGREIAVAVKEGGSDQNQNSKLRDAVAKAKAANMPNENISRSIKKAAGEGGNVNYEEIQYEGYGLGGVAVIVEALTDNRNRTASEVRHTFDKYGGSLGATGCVSWMFEKKGVIVIEKKDGMDDDEMMLIALDAGADDFEAQEDGYYIYTQVKDFTNTREELEKAGYEFDSAQLEWVPNNNTELQEENLDKFNLMLDKLEDLDDVQNIYHNAEDMEEST